MKHVVLTIFCLFFIFPHTGNAAPSYTVTPLVIDVKALPRDVQTHEIVLANTGSSPVTVYPSVNNISLEDGGSRQQFLPPAASDRTTSLASWIEITRSGVDLPKGETKTIPLTLRINPYAKPGVYHAVIGFGYGRNTDEAGSMVKNGRAPSIVVTVTITEEKNEFLKLSRFLIDRFITSGDNQAAVYTISNPGDESLTPGGEIIFYDKRGVEVSSLKVNPENLVITPGKQEEFTAVVPTKGLFGKYKAFLSVEYGSSQLASVQDTTYFYVFPLQTILIILGIISLIVIIGALYVHKRYFSDVEFDDSDPLPVHIRPDVVSDAREHDIHLTQHD